MKAVHGLPLTKPETWNWFIDAHGEPGKIAYKSFMNDPDVIAEWWPKMDEIVGAVPMLHRIIDSNVELVFVTHRRLENVGAVTAEWLTARGLGGVEVLFASGNKHALIDADFWLDDNVDVIQGLIDEGHKNAYLFDQPWNRHVVLPRLTGWDEVIDAIDWCVPPSGIFACDLDGCVINFTGWEEAA
jgi:hypothetical protein